MLKKLLTSFLVAIIFLGNFVHPTKAEWYDQGPLEFSQKVFEDSNDIFGERYTFAQVGWIMNSILVIIAGQDLSNLSSSFEAQNNNSTLLPPSTDRSKMGGTFGLLDQGIAAIYRNPVASGGYWIGQGLKNFSLVPEAYAQSPGFGFQAISVFQSIWRASRNIAYLVLVVITIALGFAIMFRVKINPQTVVTIQSAIPKLVFTIILITFSYAIVGFLIDLMYLVFAVAAYGMQAFGAFDGTSLRAQDLFAKFVSGGLSEQPILGWVTAFGVVILILQAILLFVPGLNIIGVAVLPLGLALLGITLGLVFKIFVMLAKSYFSLIVNLTFGPLILLAEALPIGSAVYGWLRSVVADLLVFTAVGFTFFVYQIIDGKIAGGDPITWSPPYIGNNVLWIRLFLAVGVLGILPGLRESIYKLLRKQELGGDLDFSRLSRGAESTQDNLRRASTAPGYAQARNRIPGIVRWLIP